MRIYFTRHGESQANLLKEISNRGLRHGLTRKGREQAVALAERLRNLPITHIYASPMLRAIETGFILADRLGLDYEVVDALREYDCGIAEGRSDAEAWQLYRAVSHAWVVDGRWEERIEGGESFRDIRDRFVPFIEGLVSRYAGAEAGIVCVSHGGLYWTMLPLVLKNVDRGLIARNGIDYTSCIVSEWRPAGLTCVGWDGRAIEEESRAMRKSIVGQDAQEVSSADRYWLDVERLARVEITSEDAGHPFESALLPDAGPGWRAAGPGEQTIRLLFDTPMRISRIRLVFDEQQVERAQEFVLRWLPDGEPSYRELRRQGYNFSPPGTTREVEDFTLNLDRVTALELSILPNTGGGEARASLTRLQLA